MYLKKNVNMNNAVRLTLSYLLFLQTVYECNIDSWYIIYIYIFFIYEINIIRAVTNAYFLFEWVDFC